MAALSGAVGGGVGQVLGKGGMLGSQFVGDAVRGAAASALTQGIGVAVGLQKQFDFAAVAAAGIAAGVIGAASRKLASKGLGVAPENITPDTVRNAGFYANQALSGAAGAIANAATRTLANGSDFGDNILAALPDVIGSTIGNLIADPITSKMEKAQREARIKKLAGSDILPDSLRGTAATNETVREAVETGASNKQVRRMLSASATQEYIANRQAQLDARRPLLRPAVLLTGFGEVSIDLSLAAAVQGATPATQVAGPEIITLADGTRTDGFGVRISGTEPIYDPARWNVRGVVEYNNCYAYALNDLVVGRTSKPQPGGSSDNYLFSDPNDGAQTLYVNRLQREIRRDGQAIWLGTTPESTLSAPPGTYIVALVVDTRDGVQDYHWYRHNPDGSWSGKGGSNFATNRDYDNRLIVDPRTANRYVGRTRPGDRPSGTLDYNQFVGYYAVAPGAKTGPRGRR